MAKAKNKGTKERIREGTKADASDGATERRSDEGNASLSELARRALERAQRNPELRVGCDYKTADELIAAGIAERNKFGDVYLVKDE